MNASGGGGGGTSSGGTQDFYFPGIDEPWTDPYEETKCYFPASNTNRDFRITIYVDQPGDNYEGSSKIGRNVGHTFIGFKSVDKNTGDVIERIFGSYPSESSKAVIGSTPRINSNEKHIYDVSITFSVSPEQMRDAAQAALNNSSDQYVLCGNKCTNYAESIGDAAGLSLPESSRKIWQGDTWGFVHSPGVLGKMLKDMKDKNPALSINVPASPLKVPKRSGNCN